VAHNTLLADFMHLIFIVFFKNVGPDSLIFLRHFDAVGLVMGRASGLQKYLLQKSQRLTLGDFV